MEKVLRTREDLLTYLSTRSDTPANYKIAVGLLLFTVDDKVVLLKRGEQARDAQGLFEGVGGSLDPLEDNLIEAIRREVSEEIGDVNVSIDRTLGVKILPGESNPWWVVVDFLGKVVSGTPRNMEPHKAEGVYELNLEEIGALNLSKYQRVTMDMYKEQFGTIPYYKS